MPIYKRKGYYYAKKNDEYRFEKHTRKRLVQLRLEHDLSQRDLAIKMQTYGYDMDKNVITRIETGKRYVTDIELYAFSTYFKVSSDYLIGLTSDLS